MPTPLTLTVYGAGDCDDTERVHLWLAAQAIAFHAVDIDQAPAAEQFVIFINQGFRSTPTLVFGEGRRKLIVTEPTDEELAEAVREAGLRPG